MGQNSESLITSTLQAPHRGAQQRDAAAHPALKRATTAAEITSQSRSRTLASTSAGLAARET